MNWAEVQGQSRRVGALLRSKWAGLTADDLELLAGKKEAFLGRLQQRSGLRREEVERQFDDFVATLDLNSRAHFSR